MNLIKRTIFKATHNVDAILASMNAATQLLDEAVTYHNNAAAASREEANRLAEKAEASAAEAKRASRVANKIKDLIS